MSKLVNTEIFISKAKTLHGEKYDYSETNYIGTKQKVKIICPVHGVFEQTPSNHYQFGCKSCADQGRGEARKLNPQEALDKLLETHSGRYEYPDLLTNYKTTKDKITINCKVHGEFNQEYENHILGQGCPYCRFSGSDGLTTLYLCKVKDRESQAIKVGLTAETNPMIRLKHLTKVEKEVIFKIRLDSRTALELENEIKEKFCFDGVFSHPRVKKEFFYLKDLDAVVDIIMRRSIFDKI